MPPTQPAAGLTTKVSLGVIAALTLFTLVSAFLDGDHSTETIVGIAGAVATLVGLTLSRGYQAGKIIEKTPVELPGKRDGALDEEPDVMDAMPDDALEGRTACSPEEHARLQHEAYVRYGEIEG